MRRQIRSTTSSSSPRIAAIEPGFFLAASAIAIPRSRTSAIASSTFSAPGEARRDERRLLHLRLHELSLGRLEAEVHEIQARRLAPLLEHLHRLGKGLRELTAHARLERSLAREAERDLAAVRHSVHSIRPEPHVRPAPMPVINTKSPFFKRPSSCASASASGIEPEDVFP